MSSVIDCFHSVQEFFFKGFISCHDIHVRYVSINVDRRHGNIQGVENRINARSHMLTMFKVCHKVKVLTHFFYGHNSFCFHA